MQGSLGRVCSVPSCDGKLEAKGFCMTHYSRLLRGVTVDAPVRRVGFRRPCSVASCENNASAKGLCKTHYGRHLRGARLDAPIPVPRTTMKCNFSDCNRRVAGYGLCVTHRKQQRDGRELRPIVNRFTKYEIEICTISGCDRHHHAQGMCQRHFSRASRHKLSSVQFQALLLIDDCPICHDEMTEKSGAIDHDHACCPGERTCGKCIRGMICVRCNAGIGYFANDPGILMAAVDYLHPL